MTNAGTIQGREEFKEIWYLMQTVINMESQGHMPASGRHGAHTDMNEKIYDVLVQFGCYQYEWKRLWCSSIIQLLSTQT